MDSQIRIVNTDSGQISYSIREVPNSGIDVNEFKNCPMLMIMEAINCRDLSTIIDANPGLKEMYVKLVSNNSIESSSVIKKMSQLKGLTNLMFVFIGEEIENSQQLSDAFGCLAMNLKKLKKFYLKVESISRLDTNDLLSQFRHFSNLQSLDINLDIVSENSQELNFEWLKTCHRLTELRLFSKVSTFAGSISQIPLYSPKLRILWLFTKSQVNITDEDLKCLAQLKHLTQLGFASGSTDGTTVTDTGIVGLIDRCPYLQLLKVHQKVSITSQTIRRMRDKAIERPEKMFRYDFGAIVRSEIDIGFELHFIFDSIRDYESHSNKVDIDSQLKQSIVGSKNLFITGINIQ